MFVKDSDKSGRFFHIDALRAVAALSVLVYHLVAHISRSPDTSAFVSSAFHLALLDWIDLGRFGVVLFFFISGFVIPFSLEKGGLRRFWVGRLCRLYPPFWVGVLAVVGTEWIFRGTHYSLFQVALNLTMVPQLLGGRPVSGIYWTLFVEMLFYVFCAFLYSVRLRWDFKLSASLALGLAALSAIPIASNGFFGTHFPVQFSSFHLSFLFAGTLVRQCVLEGGKEELRWMGFVLLSLLSMVFVVSGAFFKVVSGFVQFGSFSIIAAYILATVVFVTAVYLRKPTGNVLLRLGECSYSLYLLHWPVCVVLISILPDVGGFNIPLLMLSGIVFSIAVAALAYRLVEMPFIKLGKVIVGAVEKGKVVPAKVDRSV